MLNLAKAGSFNKLNKSSDKSPSYGGSTSKTRTPVASPGPKVINITLIRAPTTFGRETQKMQEVKDKVVSHESRVYRSLREDPTYKQSITSAPKRDPILQDNGEDIEVRRYKRPISQERYATTRDEIPRAKKHGEFNERYNPRDQDPKPQGIRAFKVLGSECMDENQKRSKNPGRSKSTEFERNPITEGEKPMFRRKRKPVDFLDEHQKLNDKKYLLPFERGCSPHGKSTRQTTITFDDSSFDSSPGVKQRSQSLNRSMSAMQLKMRGIAKGIIEYDEGPKFRSEVLPEKINTIKFSDLVNAREENRVFGRTTTLGF